MKLQPEMRELGLIIVSDESCRGRISIQLVLVFVLTLGLIAGCSWDRRKPLIIQDISRPLPVYHDSVVVYFEEFIPGKPLPETVWDNAVGPLWDVGASNQIGFTQNYSGTILPLPPGVVSIMIIRTRIVMPFGRNFTGVFESALKKSFARYSVCYDDSCLQRSILQGNATKVLIIKVSSFHTWEGPMNHLNFYAKGSCKVLNKDGTPIKEYSFQRTMPGNKLGGVFNTHSSMIDAMNRFLNQFSEDLAADIITADEVQAGKSGQN
jgi:hypothetical protein